MSMPGLVAQILDHLEQATTEGRVAWQEGTGRSEVLVIFPKASIRLYQYVHTARKESGFTIQILDSEGDVAEEFSAPLETATGRRLRKIHRLAIRKTRTKDEVLSEVIRDLRKEGTIGQTP